MKPIITSLLIAVSVAVSENRYRQIIQEETQYAIESDRQEQETQKSFDETLKRVSKERKDQMNWSPDNDTTKEENKGRYWDSGSGEYKRQKR